MLSKFPHNFYKQGKMAFIYGKLIFSHLLCYSCHLQYLDEKGSES